MVGRLQGKVRRLQGMVGRLQGKVRRLQGMAGRLQGKVRRYGWAVTRYGSVVSR